MSPFPAVVLPAPHQPLQLRELSEPDLEPDSGLLEVECSEVCGTDVYLCRGSLAGVPYPIVPGHVAVGRLARIRGRLLDQRGEALREGDRVTFLDVHATCHACWYCLVAKATTRCPHRKVYGITYGLADGPCGGWSRFLYLKPGTRCISLGEMEPERFMAGGCSLPTALHAVERGRIRPGESVLILGSGPVGLSSIILARLAGALKVLCIGAPDTRLQVAREVGADAVLNFQERSWPDKLDWVLAQTGGRGPDVTIEAAGAPQAVVEAMRYTRPAGRVVVVGQYTDHGEVSFNPHLDLNQKHLEVKGCWGSDFSHFLRGAELISHAGLGEPWSRIPLTPYRLSQIQQAVTAVAAGEVVKALVLPEV